MNNFSTIKHTVLLALFIALIPAPAHASFADNVWSFIKQNTATIATAAVGLLCCGLVWWKKNNDLEKLKSAQASKLSSAKSSTGAQTLPTTAPKKDDALDKLKAASEAVKKRALEQLTTTKNAEKESALTKFNTEKDAEKTAALAEQSAAKDREKQRAIEQLKAEQEAALAQQRDANTGATAKALQTFTTKAETQLKEKLDASIAQEKAKIDGRITALMQKMQKLVTTSATLKDRYTALQLKHKASLNLPHEAREVTEFLKKAQEICDRAEKTTAHIGEKQYTSTNDLNALKAALVHIQARLQTLLKIASGEMNYGTIDSFDRINPYQGVNLNPLLASMMPPESIRTAIEILCGKGSNPIKGAMLAIFENEFSKKHFDLSLKGNQHLKAWEEFIKIHRAEINSLHSKISTLLPKVSQALRAAEKLEQSKQLHDKTSHSGSGAAASKKPNANATKPATAQPVDPHSTSAK